MLPQLHVSDNGISPMEAKNKINESQKMQRRKASSSRVQNFQEPPDSHYSHKSSMNIVWELFMKYFYPHTFFRNYFTQFLFSEFQKSVKFLNIISQTNPLFPTQPNQPLSSYWGVEKHVTVTCFSIHKYLLHLWKLKIF